MADTILQPSRPVEEKGVTQHHETSDSSQHSHQNMTGLGSEEAMHESEKDIPVGSGCSTSCCDSADRRKDDLPSLHGLCCYGFLVDWKSDPSLSVWYVKINMKAMI